MQAPTTCEGERATLHPCREEPLEPFGKAGKSAEFARNMNATRSFTKIHLIDIADFEWIISGAGNRI